MLFVSKKRGLRLIKRPTDIITDENRRSQVVRGEKVEFIDGRYQTDKQDIIDWLIGNEEKGIPPHEELIRGRFTAVAEDQLEAMRKAAVQMVTGANTTGSRMGSKDDGAALATQPSIVAVAELLAESEQRTDAKIGSALGQIMEMLKGTTTVPKTEVVSLPTAKTKKVFTCPIPGCGKTFTTGMAVGKHKREAHPEVYVSKGE